MKQSGQGWCLWCQEEDIEEEEHSTETLLRQVTTKVTTLAQKVNGLKETEA